MFEHLDVPIRINVAQELLLLSTARIKLVWASEYGHSINPHNEPIFKDRLKVIY